MSLIAQHTIPRGWPYEFELDLALAAMPLYSQAEDSIGGTNLPAWGQWVQAGIYLSNSQFCSELRNFKIKIGGLKTPLPALSLPGDPPLYFNYFLYSWGGLNILDSVKLSWLD